MGRGVCSLVKLNWAISRLYLLISIFVALGSNLYSAETDSIVRYTKINIGYHRGFVYPHHQYLQFHNNDYINGLDFRAGKTFPNINTKRTPTIGFGGFLSNLGNTDLYGNLLSAYSYFESPILMRKGFVLGTNVSSGLGWITKPNHPFLNPMNQAIGSHLNAFILLALDFKFRVASSLTLFVSPSLIHNSNGKIKLPNTGLNIFSLRVGLDYDFREELVATSPNLFGVDYSAPHRINFLLSGGLQEDNKQKPIPKGVWGLNTNYSYLLGNNGRAGAGVDLFYIPTEYKYYTENEVVINPSPWSGGIYLGYEIVWQKLSFVLQQGVRMFYENPYESDFYSRVGFRYRFARNYVANCSLKTSRLTAEYVEWGIGYDFNF